MMKTANDEFVFPWRESGDRSCAPTGHGDLCATQPASELAGYSQLSLRDKAFADLSPTRSRRQNLAAALRLSPTLCRSDERRLATRVPEGPQIIARRFNAGCVRQTSRVR